MADAAAAPTESVANLHLDEVTGERVSKSELKKRQKGRDRQREKEMKEEKKAATAPPKPAAGKKNSQEEEESNLTPNVCSEASSNCFPG
jgi:lysyl-tRNA synthetase class 2